MPDNAKTKKVGGKMVNADGAAVFRSEVFRTYLSCNSKYCIAAGDEQMLENDVDNMKKALKSSFTGTVPSGFQ